MFRFRINNLHHLDVFDHIGVVVVLLPLWTPTLLTMTLSVVIFFDGHVIYEGSMKKIQFITVSGLESFVGSYRVRQASLSDFDLRMSSGFKAKLVSCFGFLLEFAILSKVVAFTINHNSISKIGYTRSDTQIDESNRLKGVTTDECIGAEKPCDGNVDCKDGSDESSDCEEVVKGCTLPSHPVNGLWQIQGGPSGLKPDKVVARNTLLLFTCYEGYRLSSEVNLIACLDDGWTGDPPDCEALCPALQSSDTTKVHCYDENQIEIKCSQATHGASARFECATYYEPSDRRVTTRYCWQGMWDLPPPRCIPVCGEKRVSAEPLIINGQEVVQGDYPWVTAVYHRSGESFTNVCGGTMLSQKVILTAAHCVTNQYGDALPLDMVKVGVGKYYNAYKDERDIHAQYSKVQKFEVNPRYKGNDRRYEFDIAFIITTKTLLLSKVVQPACFSDLKNIHLNTRSQGIITGWGYTEADGEPSEELKEIAIPFKDDVTCYRELPSDWADKYFNHDKLCAGHHYKSTAVCKGDSGGGLVFKNRRDQRFYVHGIVSIGRKINNVGCDAQHSSLYTKVAVYYEWLEKVTSRYSFSVSDHPYR